MSGTATPERRCNLRIRLIMAVTISALVFSPLAGDQAAREPSGAANVEEQTPGSVLTPGSAGDPGQCLCDYYPDMPWILAWSPYDPSRPDTFDVGSTVTSKTLTFYNCRSVTDDWWIEWGAPWLNFSPSNGYASGYCDEDQITMYIDRAYLVANYPFGRVYAQVWVGFNMTQYSFYVEAEIVNQPDTCRYEHPSYSWVINDAGDSLSTLRLFGWTDQTVGNINIGFVVRTSTGGGYQHDDSLLVVDRFDFSTQIPGDIYRYYRRSLLDESYDPNAQDLDNQGFNGYRVWVNATLGGILQKGVPTHIGNVRLKIRDPSGLPAAFNIEIDSVASSSNWNFTFGPLWGEQYRPAYRKAIIQVQNNLGPPRMLRVPSQYATIAAALSAARDDDTIYVEPQSIPLPVLGNTNISIGKAVYLISEPVAPYAYGTSGYAFTAAGDYSYRPHVRFEGLWIEGFDTGIIVNGQATITGCRFESNGDGIYSDIIPSYAKGPGSGISAGVDDFSEFCIVSDCAFVHNSIGAWGAFRASSCTFQSCGEAVSGHYSDYPQRNYKIDNCDFLDIYGIAVVSAGFNDVKDSRFEYCNIIASSSGSESWVNSLVFQNCTFSMNNQGITVDGFVDALQMSNCLYHGNAGAIHYDSRGGLEISRSTIANNTGATALTIVTPGGGTVLVSNSIVANNSGSGVYYPPPQGQAPIKCCDFFANGQNYSSIPDQTGLYGNIAVDPLFCDPAGGDFSLADISPCAPPNNSCATQIGAYAVSCYSPAVTDIPDQSISEGGSFAAFDLDNYVTDVDNSDSELNWSYSGNVQLSVSINAARVVTIIVPHEEWSGEETITFTVADPNGLHDQDAATFSVAAVNDAPVVGELPGQTIAEGESFAGIILDDYVVDVDNDDAELDWYFSGNVDLGVYISQSRTAVISVPDADWFGSETIVFGATDPGGLSGESSALFTVTPVNDAPLLADIPGQTVAEGESFAEIHLDDYAADVDNEVAELVWTFSGNTFLTIAIDGSHVATITPVDPEWAGEETITFRATDPQGLYDEDQATFIITSIGHAPVVGDIPDETVAAGQPFASVSLDDYVDDPDHSDADLVWTISGNAELSITIDDSHTAVITPPSSEWVGSETVTFRATDPDGLFDEDQATFTVTAVSHAPVVSNIPDQTISEGEAFTAINLDDYVADQDNSDDELQWTYSGNTQLTVAISTARVATVSLPQDGWIGQETVTFRATDPDNLFDEDQVTFTVLEIQHPPVVADIPDQLVQQGSSFTEIHLDDYVTDADHSDVDLTWTYTGNSVLAVSIDDLHVATVTPPDALWTGEETVTFRATDPDGLYAEDEATFIVSETTGEANLTVSSDSLDFGTDLASLAFEICCQGLGEVYWEINDVPGWASLNSYSGTVTEQDCDQVSVLVDRDGLMAGPYVDTLHVAGAVSSVAVELRLYVQLHPDPLPASGEVLGVLVSDSARIRFNGRLAPNSVGYGVDVEGSQPLRVIQTIAPAEQESVSALLVFPDSQEEFYELDRITVRISEDLLDENFRQVLPCTLTFVTGAAVWPGETNNDGVVDERDILPIGVYCSETGPARDSMSIEWRRHLVNVVSAGLAWIPYEAVYADADGDGDVDVEDVCGITENWASTSVLARIRGQSKSSSVKQALKQFGKPFLYELYEALLSCPDSEGRHQLKQTLEDILNQPETPTPSDFALEQNYPNPFNSSTLIPFHLANPGTVRLAVLNVAGQQVQLLFAGPMAAGAHTLIWNGCNDNGESVASGVYFYELSGQGYRERRKMLLLR